MGRIAGFDHVAITAANPEATMAFYRDVLGAEVLYEDKWRAGKTPVYSLQLGANRINVHDPVRDAQLPPHLVAGKPVPGSEDFCFRWEGSIDEAIDLLSSHSVPVIEGPVFRLASNNAKATSVYFNDPDGNLLELLTIG
jgi:catechol 2,3-dioxygenase-like lactoylglutathione lyase family enzyme